MNQKLYNQIVSYILENQESFYRLSYSYARNKEDALDIVQNAICQALEHFGELKNTHAIKTWFYRILVNESLRFLKKRDRELPSEQKSNEELPYFEQAYEGTDNLYEMINRLDKTTQMILKLRFYEELSLKEIAEVAGMNLNTVKARLYRGLGLLKQNIKEDDLWIH